MKNGILKILLVNKCIATMHLKYSGQINSKYVFTYFIQHQNQLSMT